MSQSVGRPRQGWAVTLDETDQGTIAIFGEPQMHCPHVHRTRRAADRCADRINRHLRGAYMADTAKAIPVGVTEYGARYDPDRHDAELPYGQGV